MYIGQGQVSGMVRYMGLGQGKGKGQVSRVRVMVRQFGQELGIIVGEGEGKKYLTFRAFFLVALMVHPRTGFTCYVQPTSVAKLVDKRLPQSLW